MIKLFEKNIGKSSLTLVLAMIFLDHLKSQATKAKINNWVYIKPKSFCTAKETIKEMRRQPTKWEKIFANHIINAGLISKIYKKFIQFDSKI